MNNWSVQRRVLFIALVPAALVALVLSAYNTNKRINEVESTTVESARALARHLAPLSEFGVLSGNEHLLETIARSTLRESPTLASVTIRGAAGNVLARSRRQTRPAEDDDAGQARPPNLVMVREPIRRTLLTAADDSSGQGSNDPALQPGERIGEVVIGVDLAPVRSEQAAVLYESLAITGLLLLCIWLLATRIGRSVTGPVQSLTRTVDAIHRGDLHTRPTIQSGGELGALERGVAEMAEEIEQTQTSLQERVSQATQELQQTLAALEERNAELEEARQEAEAASEFKSRFLANISHEIRTPMNSILGFTELLEEAELEPAHADYLATIRNSADSLLSMLNGILDLSKIESGRMDLEFADTNLNALLIDVYRLFAPRAMHYGVEFLVELLPPEEAHVRTDAVRLKQVLINLASNAVKFTEAGYIRVGALCRPRPDGRRSITLSVEDTGCGIPESAQTRLFQAFAQGRNARDAHEYATSSGTGLGLHIASEIVFLMDGMIEFHSHIDEGSSFWFTLELEPSAESRPAPTGEQSPLRIALVDAEPAACPVHKALFEAAGMTVECSPNQAALQPDPDRHDLVIVHISARAVVSGAIEAVRPRLREAGLPVLAYAHAHTAETRRAILDAGYTDLLTKTADPSVLHAALHRRLGPPEEQPVARAERPPDARSASGCDHVLIVDDHPVNLKLFESYLADRGVTVTAAHSADEALYRAGITAFDAILMDVHLPDGDGIEATRTLRAEDGPNATTPIIAITADAFEDQRNRAMEAGVNDLLVKPVSRHTLLERLAAWCTEGPTNEALPDVDPEEAARRAGGKPEIAAELFRMFLDSLPESRTALQTARTAGDAERVRAAAHRLRGAAAYCGVPRLEAAVGEAERLARGRDWSMLAPALDELDATIEQLLDTHAGDSSGHA